MSHSETIVFFVFINSLIIATVFFVTSLDKHERNYVNCNDGGGSPVVWEESK